jgi:hypothetical protein
MDKGAQKGNRSLLIENEGAKRMKPLPRSALADFLLIKG